MDKLKYFFAVLFALSGILNAQSADKYIGKAGNEKISEREFKIRYELVPHLSRDQFSEDSSKQDLANSIIAEKLLAIEANRLGFDTTEYYKYSAQQIKDLLVRDALYNKVISAQVNISQQDIQKAIDRKSKSLEVKIISAQDSSIIYDYYKKIQSGVSFDSIEKYSDELEYDSNKAVVKITFGQMQDDFVEDTLYSLKIGNYTSPVKTNGGWFIFKLIGIKSIVPMNAKDPDYDKTILNVIRMRKSRIVGLKYLGKFYKNKKAVVDSTLFIELTNKVSEILTQKKANHDYGNHGLLYLDEQNLIKLMDDFGPVVLKKDIVHIPKTSLPLKEYLFSLIAYPFTIKDPSLNTTAYSLMENLNKYIQYKFLAEEGLKQGLQNAPEVKEDINIWKEDYLAKMLKNTFKDSVSVTDEEIKNEYLNSSETEKVNIIEILNDDLEVIETVFKELQAGKDFRELAKTYSQRTWTKANGGEFGYFPVSSFGKIGKIASRMKMNEIYGPVKTDSGYSVIKLIGRKSTATKSDEDFDSVKTQIKYSLLGKEFDEKFYKYIARLAEKYQFSIDEKALKNVKVTSIPMFAYRYIGFGGRIAAVPYLGPWYEWIKYLPKQPEVMP
ncbi:MAG: peptidylprolyl isomerase [Ignavibacteriaceae bacterium]|nr:peptidylprolyl isomerase [Ignavibacteriaceae bacterium]